MVTDIRRMLLFCRRERFVAIIVKEMRKEKKLKKEKYLD